MIEDTVVVRARDVVEFVYEITIPHDELIDRYGPDPLDWDHDQYIKENDLDNDDNLVNGPCGDIIEGFNRDVSIVQGRKDGA